MSLFAGWGLHKTIAKYSLVPFIAPARPLQPFQMFSRPSMMALGMAGGVAAAATLGNTASASGAKLHAQKYDWKHENWFTSLDSASLRRGYEVYRQICSTCHSMELLSFRHLVGVTHTEEQAKMLAGTYTIMDGPNDKGEMFERPRKVAAILFR